MYIHYGCDHFNFDRLNKQYLEAMNNNFCNQNNFFLNKPPIGLWASPVNAHLSWKDWCEAEDFHTDSLNKSFTFSLTNDAKVLMVRSMDDVNAYIKYGDLFSTMDMKYVDFEKIIRHFDAMELRHDDNYWELHTYPGMFNSWDVDSIVVWNPRVVREIKIEQIAS